MKNIFTRPFGFFLGSVASGSAFPLSYQIPLAEDIDGIPPFFGSGGSIGTVHHRGGALAHRRWKKRRASGITMRKRR